VLLQSSDHLRGYLADRLLDYCRVSDQISMQACIVPINHSEHEHHR
jgi:hypothetical protein